MSDDWHEMMKKVGAVEKKLAAIKADFAASQEEEAAGATFARAAGRAFPDQPTPDEQEHE